MDMPDKAPPPVAVLTPARRREARARPGGRDRTEPFIGRRVRRDGGLGPAGAAP
ncbi:hypothetical protein [Actinomadura sp. KC345]|uniref:hypothetical protein n=1 Tax=Actinomadura sp. KC345 TaxID=2530371 RepID=UPI001404A745|nr:hypothetical protein [Actinomadura sp. KC345]